MVNPRTAKALVVGSVAGAGILASLDSLATGSLPSVTIAIGGVIAGSVLYAAAGPAPELAGAFALVLLTGAILTNGVRVVEVVTKSTHTRSTATSGGGGGGVRIF